MVCKNGSWDVESTYDMIKNKLGHMNYYVSGKGNFFYPFSEIISGGDYPLVPF